MRHAPAEQRVACGLRLVHVCVEDVPGKLRKLLDVRHRHGALGRVEGVADDQGAEGLAEWVGARIKLATAARPAPGDRGDHIGAALHRRALHVVHQAADAAHLLPAPGATRAAMHQVRQRGAVAGGFAGAMAVHRDDAPVKGSQPEHQLCRQCIVGAEHRGGKTAAATARERDGLSAGAVRHHRAHRPEGLDAWTACARPGSRQYSSVGAMKAPRSASAPRG